MICKLLLVPFDVGEIKFMVNTTLWGGLCAVSCRKLELNCIVVVDPRKYLVKKLRCYDKWV